MVRRQRQRLDLDDTRQRGVRPHLGPRRKYHIPRHSTRLARRRTGSRTPDGSPPLTLTSTRPQTQGLSLPGTILAREGQVYLSSVSRDSGLSTRDISQPLRSTPDHVPPQCVRPEVGNRVPGRWRVRDEVQGLSSGTSSGHSSASPGVPGTLGPRDLRPSDEEVQVDRPRFRRHFDSQTP